MQAVRSPRTRAAIVLAAAAAALPLLAVNVPASGGVIVQNITAGPGKAAPAASATSSPIIALPLQSPPINGFQPHVIFGLNNEAENDFTTFPSYGPPLASAAPVPN